jgi:hypothetical protein
MRARRYLTKLWIGRHWRYLHTRHAYAFRTFKQFGIVSYTRKREDDLP